MPLLSIIVTTYNVEDYIRSTLECITEQTLQDIEIIVVDDGSTDKTVSIVSEYAMKDRRIRTIFFEENTVGGVASAANAGINIATGDYIGFADGDDLYDISMFEKLWISADTTKSDISMCQYSLLSEIDGKESQPADYKRWERYTKPESIDLNPETKRKFLRFISVPWRKIYRRDMIEKANIRFPVGDFFYEDNPFHWATIISARKIALVPESLCKHRVARAGQTMAAADERLLRIFFHHDIIRDWLNKNAVYEYYKAELLHWLAAQLSWVSQRAEGNVQNTLFDRLTPIVSQYENSDIEEFRKINGPGRASQMLQNIKNGNYQAFARAAGWTEADAYAENRTSKKLKKNSSRASKQDTLVARGIYHLRASGIRKTSMMTLQYTADRFWKSGSSQASKEALQSKHTIDGQHIMAALILLQRDLRELRAELREIRKAENAKSHEDL